MFTFLKKQRVQPIDTIKSKYPKEVLEIHHEFEIASEKLLQEANDIINSLPKVNESKINVLKALGFKQVKEVSESVEILNKGAMSKKQIERVQYYQQNYPFNKFITEDQVETICHKYNLVCGDVDRFKGFVPEKNMNDIVNFKLKTKDQTNYIVEGPNGIFYINEDSFKRPAFKKYIDDDNESYVEFRDSQINIEGGSEKFGEYAKVKKGKPSLKICAPVKDMDISGLELIEGYKLEKKFIPDPIVLQPVDNGYLILTAWGDEASDPLVVNQNFN